MNKRQLDKNIEERVESNINFETDNINALKSYKKLLIRYRKFCEFRLKIISERSSEHKYDNLIDEFKEKYILIDKAEFFKRYDKDIFEAELSLLIKNSTTDKFSNIKDVIINLEQSLTSIQDGECMYYHKTVNGQLSFARQSVSRNKSLCEWVQSQYKGCHKQDTKQIVKNLQKFLLVDYVNLSLFEHARYACFVCNTSEEFRRMILNAVFSQIINVDYSDSPVIHKRDHRALRYFELRLLIWLRNKRFKNDEYIFFAKNVLADAEKSIHIENIDYHIVEILHILIAKVKNPQKVDDLILVHKLVNGLWKNGSKFLHFYTLHNEEHSIALIKNVITLVNTISYLNIKELDFYILFLACYLHDISMVIHPDLNKFCIDSNHTDIIYSEFVKEVSKCKHPICYESKSKIKHIIIDYFRKVDSYFESQVRSNHTKDSAMFVKNRCDTKYFEFIENTILQIVADVAVSHGYDACEVYGRKSFAKTELYSIKYLMILIRFADLLDLAKDRVSDYILKENINHMSSVSQFHWISHYITDRCELKAQFKIESQKGGARLRKGAIRETVIFDLYLNTKQLVATSFGCKCDKYITCSHDLNNDRMTIAISNKSEIDNRFCNAQGCTLLCKWIATKHEYLFSEIYELVKYLDTVNSGLFSTDIIVNINYDNKQVLDPKLLDCVVTYLGD